MSITTTLQVSGMTCAHCVHAVTEELSALEGVESVNIDLVAEGTSSVTLSSTTALDDKALRAAVDEAGYTVVDS